MGTYLVTQGDDYSRSNVEAIGQVHPDWLDIQMEGGVSKLKGKVTGPTGAYKVRTKTVGSDVIVEDTFVVMPAAYRTGYIPPFTSEWTVVIRYGQDYLWADGTPDAPLQCIGTPEVRLSKEAPGRVILKFPEDTIRTIESPTWASGAVGRGMEVDVYFGAEAVFYGRIFEVSDNGHYATVTAYDRLMDLALSGGVYVGIPGTAQTTLVSTSRADGGTTWIYSFTSIPGIVTTDGTQIDLFKYSRGVADMMPVTPGIDPQIIQGGINYNFAGGASGRITKMTVSVVTPSGLGYGIASGTITFVVGNTRVYAPFNVSIVPGDESTATVTATLNADFSNGDGVGAYISDANVPESQVGVYGIATTSYFTGGITREGERDTNVYTGRPIIDVEWYADGATIQAADMTINAGTVVVLKSKIVTPSPLPQYTTVNPAQAIRATFISASSVDIAQLLRDLISSTGCTPEIDQDLGVMTFYDTAMFDVLTTALQFTRPHNLGLSAQGGAIVSLPYYTVDDGVVRTLTSTGNGPDARITSRDLTVHWMAEKATYAIISEDATGQPISMESDDGCAQGSLSRALGVPVRGSTTDKTLGDYDLLAVGAGGHIVQQLTNVIEGTVTAMGYLTDIWDISGSFGGTGGRPIYLDVPEYGFAGPVVPTEVTFKNGSTEIKLDNIRTADRSEVANSMGLSADAVSNSAYTGTVHLFARNWDATASAGGRSGNPSTTLDLYDIDGTLVASVTGCTITYDAASWCHVTGYLPADAQGYSIKPVTLVKCGAVSAVLDAPTPLLAGQAVHVDFRFRYKYDDPPFPIIGRS